MEIKFLTSEKNEVEVELPNLTLAEILRIYLINDSEVTFVAWKREHYTNNPVLKVKSKNEDVKAVIKAAIRNILSDLEGVETQFKAIK